jgi:AraC family transcriptional regulator
VRNSNSEHRIIRKTMFDGQLMSIGHITVRPVSSDCGEIEQQDLNVLALPLSGVFAVHESAGHHVIASANHAIVLSPERPYRLSFPGIVGDQCLILKFSEAALDQLFPEYVSRDSLDPKLFASSALVTPSMMLARNLLLRSFAPGQPDALEIEELGVQMLVNALDSARRAPNRRSSDRYGWHEVRRSRQIELVKEAIAGCGIDGGY